MDSRPDRALRQGAKTSSPGPFMLRKKNKTSHNIFEITLQDKTRLVTSRGQINCQVLILIKMAVQLVVLNYAVRY